ncbi:phospholipid carrier-dependent glycosyltransferase [Candidatus Gottesmanbacteria bacterium]|nr:phospholipid carrier-dependent glycosyltransferase [Candidatus Gottesmanbacteria bacterium]
MLKKNFPILVLVAVAFFVRVVRLDIPSTYMFDEVYHAFTAQAYARNDPRGYEWWHKAPEGFAYEWLHPPLAKLIQAGSIKILGDTAFAWRFPGVIFATATVWLLYFFGKSLFHSSFAGLAAAFLYAFDGLSFVQSRITMNDIYLTFFLVLAFHLFFSYTKHQRKLVWVGIALGLAASTKWTGFYAIPILGGLWLINILKTKNLKLKTLFIGACSFLIFPVVLYFLSYSQFWLQGHTWQQFRELHNQTWWYQTNLRATHPYQSAAWTWPFMYRPVWYYVNYGDCGGFGGCGRVANIYAMGNPVIWWGGVIAILYFILSYIRGILAKKFSIFNFQFSILLLGYFGFFLPWALSPRIMFLYHYLPSIPFMCLALGYGLEKIWLRYKLFAICYLLFAVFVFFYFYPHLSALPMPKWWVEQYFWFPSWR